jgi:hypothetical protein
MLYFIFALFFYHAYFGKLQCHRRGKVERWLEGLWIWMLKFKDAVFAIALEVWREYGCLFADLTMCQLIHG